MAETGAILKLSGEDVRELRTVLEQTHAALVRDLAQLAGCGFSANGIELSRRRARIERLIDYLQHRPQLQLVPERLHRGIDHKIAA